MEGKPCFLIFVVCNLIFHTTIITGFLKIVYTFNSIVKGIRLLIVCSVCVLQLVAGGKAVDEGVATLGDGEPDIGPVRGADRVVVFPGLGTSLFEGRFHGFVER